MRLLFIVEEREKNVNHKGILIVCHDPLLSMLQPTSLLVCVKSHPHKVASWPNVFTTVVCINMLFFTFLLFHLLQIDWITCKAYTCYYFILINCKWVVLGIFIQVFTILTNSKSEMPKKITTITMILKT